MAVEISVPNLVDWRSTADGPLHIIFIVHFWFASWSMLGFWSGNKLIIQDIFLLLCLMWAIHKKENVSAVLLALLIDVLSVMLDIIVLATSFPVNAGSTEKFSAVIAIFNLFFRVFSVVVLYRCWKLRNDTVTVDVGLPRSNPPSVISGVHKQYNPEQTDAGYSGYGEVEGATFSTEYTGPSPAYGYGGSYQNSQAALPVPKHDLPPIPPSYSQHT